jgi:hypothetical protein
MNHKELANKIREELEQTIRKAVEKENNCIGTFYKNKGCRYYRSQISDEYEDSPIVAIHDPDINTYGGFDAATVYDLYLDIDLRLMCTLNGEGNDDWEEPIKNVQVEGLISIVEWLEANGFITVQPANPYRCADCGSINVQKMAWVRPNEDFKFLDFCSEDDEEGDNWCDDCEEHCDLIPEDELLKKINKWWKKLGIYSKEEIAGLWLYDYETNEAGKAEFNADCKKFWDGLTTEQKIEKWQTNKNENK